MTVSTFAGASTTTWKEFTHSHTYNNMNNIHTHVQSVYLFNFFGVSNKLLLKVVLVVLIEFSIVLTLLNHYS